MGDVYWVLPGLQLLGVLFLCSTGVLHCTKEWREKEGYGGGIPPWWLCLIGIILGVWFMMANTTSLNDFANGRPGSRIPLIEAIWSHGSDAAQAWFIIVQAITVLAVISLSVIGIRADFFGKLFEMDVEESAKGKDD